MEQIVIYDSPKDYPGQFVGRVWYIREGKYWPSKKPIMVTKKLKEIRSFVQGLGMVRIPRCAQDDPCIKEVWIKKNP